MLTAVPFCLCVFIHLGSQMSVNVSADSRLARKSLSVFGAVCDRVLGDSLPVIGRELERSPTLLPL